MAKESVQNVSICIANYNMEDTIEESLNSILENIPPHYEIVIVDESDDNSREIIEDLDIENPLNKIYVENMGLSRSRNLAVEEASGEIVITHVDMDDWYDSRYFEPSVEMYIRIREARDGDDFFFSCPNFNITSKKAYLERYKLRDLPIGPGERDYRWRAVMSDEFIRVNLDRDVSGRIKMSERKTISSRAKRSFNHLQGLFNIGYSMKRVLTEEVFKSDFPLHSQIFRLGITPIAYFTSLFHDNIKTNIPKRGESLDTRLERRTYSLHELQNKYDLDRDMEIFSLINADDSVH